MTEHHRDTTTFTAGMDPASLPALPLHHRELPHRQLHTKGLLAQQITQTGAGARFLETDNTYSVVTVPNGTRVARPRGLHRDPLPATGPGDKLFYEGQATAGQQTVETFAYDGFGNVTQYANLGDVGTADDVFSTIHYTGGPGGNPPA